jgi:hypothetical protein
VLFSGFDIAFLWKGSVAFQIEKFTIVRVGVVWMDGQMV